MSWVYLNSSFFQSNQSSLPDEGIVRTSIHYAFSKWQNVSSLNFTENFFQKKSNIKISFHSRNHYDGYEFDGKGQILGHAFYPRSKREGELHLDLDEDWNYNMLHGVILHEIGHSMGLSHSSDNKSVMYPWFSGKTELTHDDVQGINFLYDKKKEEETTTTKKSIYKNEEETTTKKFFVNETSNKNFHHPSKLLIRRCINCIFYF